MQIYVHTVCVLHRLVLDDKKEVKCVVLCMGGGAGELSVLRRFSPNQSSQTERSEKKSILKFIHKP